MNRIYSIILLLWVLAFGGAAFAENPGPISGTGVTLNHGVIGAGGPGGIGRNVQDASNAIGLFPQGAAVQLFDVRNYGAVCNGTGDQSGAINSAIAAARAYAAAGNNYEIKFPPDGVCQITHTINLTGLGPLQGVISDGYISCATSGAPCLDAMGSNHVTILDGFRVNGACDGTEPNVGLQFGRVASLANADTWKMGRVWFTGCFSLTGVYNFASEDGTYVSTWSKNADSTAGPGKYAWIQDGCNEYGITSAFVTTATPNTCASFNDNVFIGSSFGVRGNGNIPIVMVNTTGHRFIDSYACAGCDGIGTPTYMVLVKNITNQSLGGNILPAFDIHFETTPTSIFLIASSPSATPTIKGLYYREHLLQSSLSGGVLDYDSAGTFGTAVTGVSVPNLNIDIGATVSNAALPLFHTPSVWNVSGKVHVPLIAQWVNPNPNSYSVFLCADNLSPQCNMRANIFNITASAAHMVLNLNRTDAIAANAELGRIIFNGQNSTPTPHDFGAITLVPSSVTAGSEASTMFFQTPDSGSGADTNQFWIDNTGVTVSGTGVYHVGGTAGGTGTISVRKGDDSGACNLIFNGGLFVSSTC